MTDVRKTVKELRVGAEEISGDGIQERGISVGEQAWRIFTVYSNEEMKEKWKRLSEGIDEMKEGVLWLVGDFNARIGRKWKRYEGVEEEQEGRKLKDEVWNAEGDELIELIQERGWNIMSGNMKGDEGG